MLKFTMNQKELKTMMEKGIAAIDKKSRIPHLTRLYLQVELDGTVKALGTDTEHYAEIRSDNAWDTNAGVLGIDIDDIKVISKMSGDITLEDVSTENQNKINVKSGKKTVTIPKYENIDIFLPSMDNTEEHILTIKESWLLETIVNLSVYTSDKENKMLQVINFNTKDKRVEALDGYRIGMRSLENQKIEKETENLLDSVKIHRKCVPVFKKVMNAKSKAEVKVYQDKKYIRLEGKDFTYVTRRVDGEYSKVNEMITNDYEYIFTVDREDMLSVMKYNCELAKGKEKVQVVFHSENGELYTYMRTSKYETFDEMETNGIIMSDQLYIGFNPSYIADAFSIIDSENPVCRGINNKSPMFIDGNEYSFMILPIFIKDDIEKKHEKYYGENKRI